MGLSYRPPTVINGVVKASIKDCDIAKHLNGYEKMVVGGFVGGRYPFNYVKSSIEKAWRIKELGNLSLERN